MIQAVNHTEDEDDPEPAPPAPYEPTIEEKVVERALAATYKDSHLTKMVQNAARHEARVALRKELRAFADPDGPPSRPVDPALTYSPLTDTPVHHVRDKRPTTPEQKREAIRAFWAQAFKEQSLTLDDLHPYRVRVFYRILRELTRVFDLLQPDELLESIPSRVDGTSPWDTPRWPPASSPRGQHALALIRGAKQEFPLYPTEGTDAPLYVAVLGLVAAYLGVEHGTRQEPHLGRYGLRGLLDPELVRLSLPAPQEIALWERVLVGDTMRAVVALGVSGTEQWLQREHGLDHVECADLIKQAKAQAKRSLTSDTEEERAVMILRLESFARRARKGLSLAGELGAYKQLSIVQGFGRIEPEDAVSEFVATVRRVNAEDKRAPDELLELENSEPE